DDDQPQQRGRQGDRPLVRAAPRAVASYVIESHRRQPTPATLSAFLAALASALSTPLAHGTQPQAQCIELDEALGVALVVGALVLLEGDVFHGVERLGRL